MFNAVRIIDKNTIEVSPRWTWESERGDIVRIKEFNDYNPHISEAAKGVVKIVVEQRLRDLLLNKQITLESPVQLIESKDVDSKILECSILLDGVNIKSYFPEFKK